MVMKEEIEDRTVLKTSRGQSTIVTDKSEKFSQRTE